MSRPSTSYPGATTDDRHEPNPAVNRCGTALDFDAIIIGAGVSGRYQIYELCEFGLKARVREDGTNVAGPTATPFSEERLEEWRWPEHFPAPPDTERCLNYVADRFDPRRDIQCFRRVTAAHYQEAMRSWDVTMEDGRCDSTCRIPTYPEWI
jgi:cation diffusion facilitator CzcD-associated flavoprotein CzcO